MGNGDSALRAARPPRHVIPTARLKCGKAERQDPRAHNAIWETLNCEGG